jgi:uncharacterized protein
VADVLVDAGPLVAILHRDDEEHERSVEALESITSPLVTVWPVITEAMYLLSFSLAAQVALWDMLEERLVRLAPLGLNDVGPMRDLMEKYRDLPMDMADAALVRVAARDGLTHILTLDHEFTIYRLPRRGRFIVLPDAGGGRQAASRRRRLARRPGQSRR